MSWSPDVRQHFSIYAVVLFYVYVWVYSSSGLRLTAATTNAWTIAQMLAHRTAATAWNDASRFGLCFCPLLTFPFRQSSARTQRGSLFIRLKDPQTDGRKCRRCLSVGGFGGMRLVEQKVVTGGGVTGGNRGRASSYLSKVHFIEVFVWATVGVIGDENKGQIEPLNRCRMVGQGQTD